ncbi:Methyltransferase domain-containing protein [Oceanobacillus limi]|uniref:Methyltransferase domain-containing protein n=1 Tax=Oceanobacillus limi TaxID=930131 RepID=A0A1I0DFQ9_9BACI|nr:class I SAM-dependent methyltransferase [Oceanobacillus limi]SET31022.1 Methyltransferase domain-containing protein [Oceanobacillus limi]
MKEKDIIKSVFSKNRNAYVTSSTHSNGLDLPQLMKWIKPSKNMKALDIATGAGHVAKQLSMYVDTVYATDITKEMLQTASHHLADYQNIHYIIADAENLPFLDRSFDLVTCRIAAHHFLNPQAFIKETSRVLKSGRKFLLIDNISPEKPKFEDFINNLEKMRDRSHNRSLRISEWEQLFQENQLTISRSETKKKTLPYDEWINRTLASTKEKNQVMNYIKNAPKDIQLYYQVTTNKSSIHSISIDEWMVLCQKD